MPGTALAAAGRARGLGARLGDLAGHGHPGDRRRRADRLPRCGSTASATRSTRPATTASSSSTSSAASARRSTRSSPASASCSVSRPSRGRCPRSAGSASSRSSPGWPTRWPGVRSAVLVLVGLLLFGFLGYWADSHRHADHHVRGGAAVRDHRDPDGHLDGPQPPGRGGDHTRPRRDADHAVLRLPGPAGAGVRHRPGLGRGRHADLRGAAVDPDHRTRHPHGVPDDHRGRALDGHQPLADRCARCSCRWPVAPSSWA